MKQILTSLLAILPLTIGMLPSAALSAPIIYRFNATGGELQGDSVATATSRLADLGAISGTFSFDPSALIDEIVADITNRTASGEPGGTPASGIGTVSIDQVPGLANPNQPVDLAYDFAFDRASFSFDPSVFGGFSFTSANPTSPQPGEIVANLAIQRLSFPTTDLSGGPEAPSEITSTLLSDLTTIDFLDPSSVSLFLTERDEQDNVVSREFEFTVAVVPLPAPFLLLLASVFCILGFNRSSNRQRI